MKVKKECVAPKWEKKVTCCSCRQDINLTTDSDIFRLLTLEYPYGGIAGIIFYIINYPHYYCKCPHCNKLNCIPMWLIPKNIRKQTKLFTTFY